MPSFSPPRSPIGPDTVLIAAQSGRALAAAARRAGLRPLVADLFGDEDTRALSAGYHPLQGGFGARLGRGSVLRALDELAAAVGGHVLGVVLGSGFEGTPGLIGEIAGRYRLLGAGAEVVAELKDPLRLAALLDGLRIPHPPVTHAAVPDPANWLLKRRGGSGGSHIRCARAGPPPAGFYHQSRVPGRPYGLAILADGVECEILAVTEQWVSPGRRRPFRYGGAVDPGGLAPAMRDEMAKAVGRLVRAVGLRGLASADMLVDGDRWWLIEINPRPGATLDILDRRATPLLARHIAACQGELGCPEPPPAGAAAAEVLYAAGTLDAVPPVLWPDFVTDRPRPGQRIPSGAPICTVQADAPDPEAALALLARRTALVRTLLKEGHHHGQRTAPSQRERACEAACRGAGP